MHVRVSDRSFIWAVCCLAPLAACSMLLDYESSGSDAGSSTPTFNDAGAADASALDAATDDAGDDRSARYRMEVLADSPAAYYRFREPETSDNAVAEVGGEALNRVGAKFGRPGLFAGQDRSAGVGSGGAQAYFSGAPTVSNFPGKRTFTLEAWVKLHQAPDTTYRALFSRRTGGADSQYLVFLHKDTPLRFERRDPSGAVYQSTGSSSFVWDLEQWTHVVATYDGAKISLIVNGLLSESPVASPQDLASSNDPLWVGTRSTSGGSIDADIDEVAIYAAALPLERVREHYAAGRP